MHGLQIVSFLQQNAHPRVAERIPSVPENVTDQVPSLFLIALKLKDSFRNQILL